MSRQVRRMRNGQSDLVSGVLASAVSSIGRSGWNCTSIFRVMIPTLLLLSYRPSLKRRSREDLHLDPLR